MRSASRSPQLARDPQAYPLVTIVKIDPRDTAADSNNDTVAAIA